MLAQFSFLDLKICRKDGKFSTSVYRKPTFSRAFTSRENFIPTYQKRGLLHTLPHGNFSTCCDFKTFHFEIEHLKTILTKNNCPLYFIYSCNKSFLNKFYTPKFVVPNVPIRNTFVKLLFFRSTSFHIQKKIQKLFSDKLTSCNLKVIFKPPVSVKGFFVFKDKLTKLFFSGLVYQYKCAGISVVAAMLPIMERPNAI